MTRYRVELVELVEADTAEAAIAQVSSLASYHAAVATPLNDERAIDRRRKRNALLRALGRDVGTGNGRADASIGREPRAVRRRRAR